MNFYIFFNGNSTVSQNESFPFRTVSFGEADLGFGKTPTMFIRKYRRQAQKKCRKKRKRVETNS